MFQKKKKLVHFSTRGEGRIGRFSTKKNNCSNIGNGLKCILRQTYFFNFGGVGGYFTKTDHLKLLTSLVRPSGNCQSIRGANIQMTSKGQIVATRFSWFFSFHSTASFLGPIYLTQKLVIFEALEVSLFFSAFCGSGEWYLMCVRVREGRGSKIFFQSPVEIGLERDVFFFANKEIYNVEEKCYINFVCCTTNKMKYKVLSFLWSQRLNKNILIHLKVV